jgi:hypothetical protein
MRISMRTTVVIDDDLLRMARKQAAEAGTSLSEVVNRALRDTFVQRAQSPPQPRFSMVTFGGGQPPVDHSPAAFARAVEEEDRATLRGS